MPPGASTTARAAFDELAGIVFLDACWLPAELGRRVSKRDRSGVLPAPGLDENQAGHPLQRAGRWSGGAACALGDPGPARRGRPKRWSRTPTAIDCLATCSTQHRAADDQRGGDGLAFDRQFAGLTFTSATLGAASGGTSPRIRIHSSCASCCTRPIRPPPMAGMVRPPPIRRRSPTSTPFALLQLGRRRLPRILFPGAPLARPGRGRRRRALSLELAGAGRAARVRRARQRCSALAVAGELAQVSDMAVIGGRSRRPSAPGDPPPAPSAAPPPASRWWTQPASPTST